ncbi:hypothetical protein ACIRBZ_33735 [Streptomyces sp. NPDC094038]|uniref:hypothetical protein n=1 Tax=Streptomyces sp. NPDC094038 TaxID=3366055 RepID=UPI0037F1BEB6
MNGAQITWLGESSPATGQPYQWYESGPVTDLTIRGNTFTRPSGPVVFVEPTNQVVAPAHPVRRDVKVERNAFDVGDVTVVDAESVGGLAFSGNTVRHLDGPDRPPYPSPLFVLHGSPGIRIAHNPYDKGLNTSVVTD